MRPARRIPSKAWSTTFPTASSSFRQGMTTLISGEEDIGGGVAEASTLAGSRRVGSARARTVDGHGRFAWAAGYDGSRNMWVRARPRLSGGGPIWYATRRTLPSAPGAADAPLCPTSTEPPAMTANASTVLR